MSNVRNFRDIETNSNSSNNESRGSFGMGGYNENGKYNPWMKQQPPQQQRAGYSQLDVANQQSSSSSLLGGMNLTWKCFSAINLLLVWVVFLVLKAIAFFTENSFICLLFNSGAQYQPSITYNYEFHRYFVPIYLHGGFPHIISNTFGLFFYAFTLEKQFGFKKFVLLYILSGLGGNLFSGYNQPEQMSVGASSSLFGLFPLMILFLIENQDMNKNQKLFYVVYILIMIFANFFGSSSSPDQGQKKDNQDESDVRIIDTAAHLGGFLTGLCITIIYSQIQHPKSKYFKIGAFALLVLGLGFLLIYNQMNYSITKPTSMERYCAWK
ncbi:S54 family peptidase (macronuclear) [Tetrahymena thermophila SB210]|uniref:Rhomboid-like protease n=1 Tax=Tetrahymena thermophila (strain SB210) TaxID=312017 RepID=I7MLS9_TETTS|nr:S54 family peptidase [Tetrahymena thermophila SB210]EAS03001.2 S54 family peptidase [Tetrahymena thermophila SB210]|eukprot:XP_001023246.2 S54 family peptidase [Tetrahymena thermophila SB210]